MSGYYSPCPSCAKFTGRSCADGNPEKCRDWCSTRLAAIDMEMDKRGLKHDKLPAAVAHRVRHLKRQDGWVDPA